MANSVICAEAVIGDHVIILQNTVINHHSRVGDYATLSSGITVLGYVDIGENAFIGGRRRSGRISASGRGRWSAWLRWS